MLRAILIALFLWNLSTVNANSASSDYPIQPVPFTNVQVHAGFWQSRIDTNTRVTVPYCFQRCEETGQIGNFLAAAQHDPEAYRGNRYNDSDVFKILEGASYSLAVHPNAELENYLDELIAKIAAAQESDGYLFTIKSAGSSKRFGPGPRWSDLRRSHELYNVGHLYEAAAAHFQATGKRSLLDVALRSAELIAETFGPDADQLQQPPGHQGIELGLVRLFRLTGDRKYLDLAKFFVDLRGRKDMRNQRYGRYSQDHAPILQQTEAVGHAVRGGYFYAAVADIAALTGDSNYIDAIDGIWSDVVSRKMYLTGNVGQHGAGEGYAGAYQLTNLKAYNETCAAIALALWNHRMFLLHGDAQYIDVLERTLYNGMLAGVALSGDEFFYPNPLECDLRFPFNHGKLQRSPWFNCSCCPSNLARFIPSIPGYAYAVRDHEVLVNLFLAGTANVDIDGQAIQLDQRTDYPWDGHIRIAVAPEQPQQFTLKIRIPGWSRGEVLPSELYRYQDATPADWSLKINGEQVHPKLVDGYAVLNRVWQAGDEIELDLPMKTRRVLANDKVKPNRGRVAFERGPLVYCIEGTDHQGSVLDIWVPEDSVFTAHRRTDSLGGVTVLRGEGQRAVRADEGTLKSHPTDVTMIPYHLWCHRGQNEMAVWLPSSPESAKVALPPTIASQSKASASHCWRNDTVEALNDQVEPKHSGDHGIPRFTWWNHRGTREWVQYELEEPTELENVEVYWFDDTGRGACRTPQSWKVLYREGEEWHPVENKCDYSVARDQYNRLEFQPVKTDALRIEVQLQPNFSGGILEWRVNSKAETKPQTAVSDTPTRQSPNIILVFIDDLGWADFSCFGNEQVETENIDRLAEEGLRFQQFYVNAPICSPSRVAITTGMYPQRYQIGSYLASRQLNEERGVADWLDPEAPTLPRLLKSAGYATGQFGKWHMGGQRDVGDAPMITEYGFDASLTNFEGLGDRVLAWKDSYDGQPPKKHALGSDRLGRGDIIWKKRDQVTATFVDAAIEFIQQAEANQQPFYINVWPDDVHSPFFPPKERRGDESKKDRYLGVLDTMDEQLGTLFEYVRNSPSLRENTLILVCSDNGPEKGAGSAGEFRGYKTHLYEGGIRSPLIVWGPGLVEPDAVGSWNEATTLAAFDLVPSLLDIAGVDPPADIDFDGLNMSQQLFGKSREPRNAPLFFRRPPDRDSFYGIEDAPDIAVRSGKWKLLCEYDGSDAQLYDLTVDPGEQNNLAPENPAVAEKLVSQVVAWHKSLPPDKGGSFEN